MREHRADASEREPSSRAVIVERCDLRQHRARPFAAWKKPDHELEQDDAHAVLSVARGSRRPAPAGAGARSPATVTRYRWRGGRPAEDWGSQLASSSPRSVRRIRI